MILVLCYNTLDTPKNFRTRLNGILHTQKQILKLPQRDYKKLQQVINYLRDERCIPQELINNLIQSGKLYADVRGNSVFVLPGKKLSYRRRTAGNLQYSMAWHGTRVPKKLDCFYIVGESSRKMVLCKSTIISTSGVAANPAWLHNFITNGSEIHCGFDTDKTGDMIANKMIKQYPSIKKLRPPCHDWKKVLQQNFHPLIQPPI